MRRTILAGVIATSLMAPVTAYAQQAQAPSQEGEFLGLTKEQALTIGAGVVVGALVLHAVIPGDFTYFAGAVAGGLVANWWYHDGGEAQVRAALKQSISDGVTPAGDGATLQTLVMH